ncbi:MAG: iron(III) transport system permease protein [Candidatus Sumerlaeota bacterium]|nr:iron(III) transport system permease protein [Candidatus Sumerlaeota bacterium]
MGGLRAVTPAWVRAAPWLWLAATLALLAPLALGLGSAEALPDSSSASTLPRLAHLAWNSLRMSTGAAVFALLLAVPVALAAARLLPRRAGVLLLAIACVPLFLPPTVLAVAAVRLSGPAGLLTEWLTGSQAVFPVTEQIRGPAPLIPGAPIYTLWGGAGVLAWGLAPLAILALAAVLERTDSGAEQEALLHTGPARVLLRVTLPMAAGGLLAGGGLVFLFGIIELGVPEALRSLPVLVSEVYVQFGVYFDTRSALLASLGLGALTALVAGGAGWLALRAGATEEAGAEGDARPLPPSAGTRCLTVLGVVLGAGPGVLALGVLFWTATGPEGPGAVWRVVWGTAADEFGLTLLLGAVLALAAGVLGTLAGWGLASTRRPWPGRVALLLALVTPAPLLAVGTQVLLRLPPGSLPLGLDDALAALGQTHAPLLFVWLLRFGPIVALLVERSLRLLPEDAASAAALEGAGPVAFWRGIAWPQCRPAIAAGMLAAFALSLGEVGAAVLLLPPGTTTLGVRLLTLMHYAPTGQVSALCLLLLAPGVAAYAATAGLVAVHRLSRPAPCASSAASR